MVALLGLPRLRAKDSSSSMAPSPRIGTVIVFRVSPGAKATVTGSLMALDRVTVNVAERMPMLPSATVASPTLSRGGGGAQPPSLSSTRRFPGDPKLCDLVGAVGHLVLAQDQAVVGGPGADPVQPAAEGVAGGGPGRLAVHGDGPQAGGPADGASQEATHSPKRRGSRAAKTRWKVSWLGMPWGRDRKRWSQSCLARPKRSTSSQESAPAMVAQT